MEIEEISVLLIEDDQKVRLTIKSMLMEMGIVNVREALNGVEALKIIQDEKDLFSLIICDWNMPYKTGFEFLKDLRQIDASLPFLMITARADESSVLSAKDAEVTAYISKPFSFGELEKKIKTIFQLH